MEVLILNRGVVLDEELRERIHRRLEFALGRFRQRVAGVAVTVEDLNGPRGGNDKFCRVVARLRPSGAVVLGQTDSDLARAVDRVARVLSYRIARLVERRAGRS